MFNIGVRVVRRLSKCVHLQALVVSQDARFRFLERLLLERDLDCVAGVEDWRALRRKLVDLLAEHHEYRQDKHEDADDSQFTNRVSQLKRHSHQWDEISKPEGRCFLYGDGDKSGQAANVGSPVVPVICKREIWHGGEW